MRIGIDTGGTFTDFVVLHPDGRLESFKLRSNPKAPQEVILAGLAQIGAEGEVVHGSTVATNALLERKGARTAFVTTAGVEGLLEIGRQNRERLYDLTPPPKRLLVAPERCFGVAERVLADGTIEKKPSVRDLRALAAKLRAANVEAVAICFLHAYQFPENERAVASALRRQLEPAGVYVSVSHEVCPEFREYERGSTTAVNAYVGPLMRNYLEKLPPNVSVMQSNGGSISRHEAGHFAVRTILSGPAGGAVSVAAIAVASGFSKVLGIDMGGTSTDVCLCDGVIRESVEAYVDGLPIRTPMLEIHTVGAGGGSLASIDAGGLMRVGPESAGADPGPACYGKGDRPTVTDAHVVLGRIAEDQFLGGRMHMDAERALAAVQTVAGPLGMTPARAAAGIIRVANSNMERAVRAVSVERGHDPRDFALLAFGGCGGLHACEIAAELGMRTVIVPPFAGALSALGMLLADRVRDYAAGALTVSAPDAVLARLEAEARRDLLGCRVERFADLRYRGQSYELTVPWNPKDPAKPFHQLHQTTYGYQNLDRDVEIVTLRVRARVVVTKPDLRAQSHSCDASPPQARRVFVDGGWKKIPVYRREQTTARPAEGPALLLDYGSTTLIPKGWRFHRDATGSVVVQFRPR